MKKHFSLPEIPSLTNSELEKKYLERSTKYVAVESLRALGVATYTVVSMQENSEEFKSRLNSVKWRVCAGHINKANKLMMSMLDLSTRGKYGEALNHLAFQTFEVIIQAIWLLKTSEDNFSKYMINSLTPEKLSYENIIKNGNEKHVNYAENHYRALFEKAGLDLESFVPSYDSLPSKSEMMEEIGLDQKIENMHGILGHHQSRTSYVDLMAFYVEEVNGAYTLNPEHKQSMAVHVAAIGLPFSILMKEYSKAFFSLDDVRDIFDEYFSEFYSWFEKLIEFLVLRPFETMPENKEPAAKKNPLPIEGHFLKDKILITPLNRLPSLAPTSWFNDRLPEMLWSMLIIKLVGREKALDFFRRIIKLILDNQDFGGEVSFSGIKSATANYRVQLFEILRNESEILKALTHLKVLTSIPGLEDWPLPAIDNVENSWQHIADALIMGLDHQSQESTDCRWFRLTSRVAAGKLHYPTEDHYRQLFEYPNHGDQRAVRPSIRAGEMTFQPHSTDREWVDLFWRECFDNTLCHPFPTPIPTKKIRSSKLNYKSLMVLKEQVHEFYINNLPTTYIESKHDTIWGLTLYILSISTQIEHDSEDDILGLFGLRVVAEAYINIKYLLKKDEEQLWKKYRDYGAGKAKQTYLKFNESEDPPAYLPLKKLKDIANEDKIDDFVNIDLGDWSGENLRTRAIFSDTKDIYDTYFEWPSNFIHGHWGAVRYSVFESCMNPLHRFHRIPKNMGIIPTVKYDLEFIINELLVCLNQYFPEINLEFGRE